jgi:hypothetical protein
MVDSDGDGKKALHLASVRDGGKNWWYPFEFLQLSPLFSLLPPCLPWQNSDPELNQRGPTWGIPGTERYGEEMGRKILTHKKSSK